MCFVGVERGREKGHDPLEDEIQTSNNTYHDEEAREEKIVRFSLLRMEEVTAIENVVIKHLVATGVCVRVEVDLSRLVICWAFPVLSLVEVNELIRILIL